MRQSERRQSPATLPTGEFPWGEVHFLAQKFGTLLPFSYLCALSNPFNFIFTMAKGNMFQGMARGSVGDVVFSVLKGQQVARVRNRQPSNPRTASQMAQRALFSCAVKFYTRGIQNLFQFAFEDKKANESDYNAFMRHNAKQGIYLTKDQFDNPNYPAIGNFMVSYGSLIVPSPTFETISDSLAANVKISGIEIDSQNPPTTIGAFSALLVSSGNFSEGDILTFLGIRATGALLGTATNPITNVGLVPSWEITQITVDSSSEITLETAGLSVTPASGGGANVIWNIFEENSIAAIAFIQSRKTSSGLKVSTSNLVLSPDAITAVGYGQADVWKDIVVADWGARAQAILEGSESVN